LAELLHLTLRRLVIREPGKVLDQPQGGEERGLAPAGGFLIERDQGPGDGLQARFARQFGRDFHEGNAGSRPFQ
jgi:hypothetical protein